MENIYQYSKYSFKNPSDLRKIVFNAGLESSLEYAEPQTNVAHTVKLLFSPFGLPFIPLEIAGTNIGKVISNLSWTKDRTNPGGICSITIAPDSKMIQDIVDIFNKFSGNLYSKIWGELGVDLEDLFKPMTLCQLWIDGYHIMTGTVRSCNISAMVGNSDYRKEYSIIIEELGNLYTRNQLSMDTVILDGMQKNILDSVTKAIEIVGNLRFVTLQTAIETYCNAFKLSLLTEQGLSGSDGLPLSLRLRASGNPLGAIARIAYAQGTNVSADMFKLNSGQSFWEFIKNLVPNPWMELYTESGGRTMVTDALAPPAVLFPGFNYVVSRSAPYSNPLLGIVNPVHLANLLPFDLSAIQMVLGGDFIILTDDMIQEKSLGFDATNQATIFRAKYTAGGAVIASTKSDRPVQSVGPLNPFASGGMSTFGSQEMIQTFNCLQLFDAGTAVEMPLNIAKEKVGVSGVISKNALSNLLAVWFRNQSRFREGTITSKLIPYARAGMYCLYLPSLSGKKPENLRDIGIYYIDSISHDYSLTNEDVSATTTFNLIRGVPMPMTVAQSAMLLFDWEVLPPVSGLYDGEFAALQSLRRSISVI